MTLTDFDPIDGDAATLLLQVEARLIERVKLNGAAMLGEGNCFITEEPIPPDSYFPTGNLAVTVCLGDGQFDEGMYDGGGANQLCEFGTLIVTAFARNKIDQPPRAKNALLNESRGLLAKLKPAILQAILVDDPAARILAPWHPLKNGSPFLRGAIMPRASAGPRQLGGLDWLGLTLTFGVEFDWDLTTQ